MTARKSSFFSSAFFFIILTVLLLSFALSAKDSPVCSQCGQTVKPGTRYIVSQGKTFCSRKCFIQTLPECTICGKRSFTGGIYAMDHSFFACTDCMKLPRCFSCQIPARGTRLSDGRVICPVCARTAVSNPSRARSLFNEVRDVMRVSLGIGTRHPIHFSMVDPSVLHRLSGNHSDGMPEQGLFKYDAEVEKVTTRDYLGRKVGEEVYKTGQKVQIFVLNHLPQARMEYVIAHELAHDWMTAHYPGIRDLQIREGFAEYIAWRYNQYKKRRQLNLSIENNPDPVYGDGFRKIRRLAEKRGFNGLRQYLDFKSKQNLKQ